MIAISFPRQFWESVPFYFLFIIEFHGVVLKQRNNLIFNIQLSPSPPSILIIFPSSFPVVCYMFCSFTIIYISILTIISRSQCLRVLRCRSAAAHLLRLWVRIPPGAWMSICCECCVLSRRGLCIELITRPEESYHQWCVVECDQETSRMRRPWPTGRLLHQIKKNNNNTWWITEIMNLYNLVTASVV